MDLVTIIAIFVQYLKELIGLKFLMINEVIRALHEFYDVVRCIV